MYSCLTGHWMHEDNGQFVSVYIFKGVSTWSIAPYRPCFVNSGRKLGLIWKCHGPSDHFEVVEETGWIYGVSCGADTPVYDEVATRGRHANGRFLSFLQLPSPTARAGYSARSHGRSLCSWSSPGLSTELKEEENKITFPDSVVTMLSYRHRVQQMALGLTVV